MQNFRLRIDQDHYNLAEPTVFSGGEIHVDLSHMPSDCSHYTLKARLQSSDDIMHMFMITNALALRYPNTCGTIEIPYMPYARQDRQCADGQHFGFNVFASMLNSLYFLQTIKFYDIHSDACLKILDYHGVKYKHVTQRDIIEQNEQLYRSIKNGYMQLVAPDKGAIVKTNMVSYRCDAKYVPAFGSKVRDPETGALTGFDVDVLDFDGRDLLIVDDICDGGGTFIGLAEVLKQRNCGRIFLYVTHGIFSKGFDIFKGSIYRIYTTDSIRRDDSYSNKNISMNGLELIHIKL